MKRPTYSSIFISKFLTTVFIKPHTDEISRPATAQDIYDMLVTSGAWANFGKVHRNVSIMPVPSLVEDSRRGKNLACIKYPIQFDLMNIVDESNREIIYSYWNKKHCDLAFWDRTDPKNALLIISDVPLSFFDVPFKEAYFIRCKAQKTVSSSENKIVLWTYNNDISLPPTPPPVVVERFILITGRDVSKGGSTGSSDKLLITNRLLPHGGDEDSGNVDLITEELP